MSEVQATEPGQAIPEATSDYANSVEALQFPSDAGAPEVENAQRTQDTDVDSADLFYKDFVVLVRDDANLDDMHADNERYVLGQAIQQGLHPEAEAVLIGSKPHPDGVNTIFSYAVEVQPAHVDDTPGDTVTPTLSDKTDNGVSASDQASE